MVQAGDEHLSGLYRPRSRVVPRADLGGVYSGPSLLASHRAVDGCHRRAVGGTGDVGDMAEKVITVQPGSVADQELGGRSKAVQAAGEGA
jgi:hypothetical protein